jgi:hypothetical protein
MHPALLAILLSNPKGIYGNLSEGVMGEAKLPPEASPRSFPQQSTRVGLFYVDFYGFL